MKAGSEKWEQLKEHFNKVIDLEPDARNEFLSNLREDQRTVFDQLSDLLTADEGASSFMDEPIRFDPTLSMIGEKIGSYRIVREIDRGGMGAVFETVREDGDFDRRAAIKLTSHNLFSEDLIKRFQSEKQILARLEHPNIVRLFDGGITSNHIPYFVMEYIEGTPITTYCREKGLEIGVRLSLFGQVCDAVAYAHRQLVVHRDLKPSNILVTPDGQIKLLDFGIAKVLTPEVGSQTLTRNAPLTPEYASPEQIRGGSISTASDIYSLGVLLFELLSDLRPAELFSSTDGELTASVLSSEPIGPSTVVRRSAGIIEPRLREMMARKLRGDLDNIILKCLRRDPGERYSSAGQLGEDISSYLHGRPVKAHPESRAYRTRKFVGRNRLLVGTSATALILIVCGAGIATWQYLVASQQKLIAEQRFEQVRKVANALIFDYHDEIAKLEGSTALRERLVKDAVAYLDAISPDSSDDPALLRELGVAYRKIGDVQGLAYQANLGNLDGALANYSRSIELLEQARTRKEEDGSILVELLETYRSLAAAEARAGKNPKARETLLKAIRESERYFASHTNSAELGVLDLRLRLSLGDTHNIDLEAGRTVYEKALADALELEKKYGENVDVGRLIAKFNQRLAANSRWIGEYGPPEWIVRKDELATTAVYHARRYVEYNALADGLAGQTRPRELADGYINLANSLIAVKQFDEAEKWTGMAEEQINVVKTRDPKNVEILLDELGALNAKRKILTGLGKLPEALTIIDRALENAIRYSENEPSNIETISWVGHFAKEGSAVATRLNDLKQKHHYDALFVEYAGHYRDIVGTDWSGSFGF